MSASHLLTRLRAMGPYQRDLVAAMESYSDTELDVVRRFLTGMTDVIVAHSRAVPPS